MRPRLLDLFCGAGGAAMGYHRRLRRGRRRPSAAAALPVPFHRRATRSRPGSRRHVRLGRVRRHPRQPALPGVLARSRPVPKRGKTYPDLLAPTRDLLEQTGLPWVIENVPGAPMRPDIMICGCQVGLPNLRRVRWFETSWQAFALHATHHTQTAPVVSVTGHGTPTWVREQFREMQGRNPTIADYRAAMGIDWMNRDELSEAIPPAYTELIGHQLMQHLKQVAA